MVDSRPGGGPVSRRGLVYSRRLYFRFARRPSRAFGGTGQRFWPRIRFPRRHCFLWRRARPNGLPDCVNRFSAPGLARGLCLFGLRRAQTRPLQLRLRYWGSRGRKSFHGFRRPWVSKRWRREIEEEIGEEGGDEAVISDQ